MAQRTSAQVDKGDGFLKSGRLNQARKAYRRALRGRRDDAVALDRLASLELDAGNPADALPLLRRLAELQPEDQETRLRLASAVEDAGDPAEAEAVLRALLDDAPDNARAHNNLANVLQVQERFEEAHGAYERALELEPGSAEIAVNVGNALDELGRHGESIPYYARALERRPGLGEARYYRARALLAVGRAEEAMADVRHCLALDPNNQRALALQGVLHAELGQDEEARRLFDYDRQVQVFRPDTPAGFADRTSFLSAVVEHIRRDVTLDFEPMGASTRGGWHSQDILQEPSEAIAALKSLLQGVFQSYFAQLTLDPGHPFMRQKHSNVRIAAQAQILDSQGFLLSHIHPSGWVSGAFYLAIPDEVAEGEDDPGWIEFGRPTAEITCSATLEQRRYKPEEGMAILFPSYFFHGTRPFRSDSPRISLGMDLKPTK